MAKHLKFIARTVMVHETESSAWMGSLRTLNDEDTMRNLAASDSGKAMKPAGGSTTWKWLERSTF